MHCGRHRRRLSAHHEQRTAPSLLVSCLRHRRCAASCTKAETCSARRQCAPNNASAVHASAALLQPSRQKQCDSTRTDSVRRPQQANSCRTPALAMIPPRLARHCQFVPFSRATAQRHQAERTLQRVRRTAQRGEQVLVVANWPWHKIGVRDWYAWVSRYRTLQVGHVFFDFPFPAGCGGLRAHSMVLPCTARSLRLEWLCA